MRADTAPSLSAEQFESQVFAAEIEEVSRRRSRLGLPAPALEDGPTTRLGLVGLALSGGGIRCASLSLGVLQALARRGVLRHVDYLSTVSGGGLVGSCLSTLLNSPTTSPDPEGNPLAFRPGMVEQPAVSYLRNNSSYLAPGGTLDKVRLPALILSGIANNLLLVLPLLMLAVFVVEILYALGWQQGEAVVRALPGLFAGAFLAAVLLHPILYRLLHGWFTWPRRDRYEAFLALALVLLVVALLLIPVGLLVEEAVDLTWQQVVSWPGWSSGEIWVGLGVLLVLFALAGRASEGIARWSGRLAILALGVLGPLLLFAGFLLLTLYQVDSPVLDPGLRADLDRSTASPELRQALDEKGIDLDDPASIRANSQDGPSRWRIDDGTHHVDLRLDHRQRLVVDSLLLWDGEGDLLFVTAGALALVLALFFANPNVTSPHGFFRDRLSRAFLFDTDERGEVRPQDDLELSALNRDGSAAPYHLINATLNLQGSSDPALRGRGSDFFIFSRHYSGGPRTGYCRTSDLERYDAHLDLGTAMAISGAGLAPNMGTTTVRPLVFILTLLNLRLGYWLPNPRRVHAGSRLQKLRLHTSVGPVYLLLEALGKLDAERAYVNVSDGGHLENMAIYELLRRRCRWILAVDGEEDPSMSFGGLLQLIRFARIDLGIEIDIALDELHPGADGYGKAHWALGRIDYGGGESGYLIYLKSSLTGDEEEYVLAYHSRHPTFPQESSADQFFTETQFEVHRALGEHIAEGILGQADDGWPQPPPWQESRREQRA